MGVTRRYGISLATPLVALALAAPAGADTNLVQGVVGGVTADPVNYLASTAEGTPALVLSKVAEIAPAPANAHRSVKHRRHRRR